MSERKLVYISGESEQTQTCNSIYYCDSHYCTNRKNDKNVNL
jgi:hypothetical protein